ncbi:RICIN domain-containing protein [Micromonospora sp. NPDC001898]|uniref:RICIN domain-containing protein n=1 Tax=Micromonospora sp. NPDC001898 TaxID=3364221 RepID=UPI00367D7991
MIHSHRGSRVFAAGFGAVILAVSLLVWPTAGATAQPDIADPNGRTTIQASYHQLQNPDTNMCLTLYNGNAYDGAPLVVMPCDPAVENNLWTIAGESSTLVSQADNTRCVDVYGGTAADGVSVVNWGCHGLQNQQWTLNNDGRLLSNLAGGPWCLTIYGDNPSAGAIVILKTCPGATSSSSPAPSPSPSPSTSASPAIDLALWKYV